jgi:hypothetical protein
MGAALAVAGTAVTGLVDQLVAGQQQKQADKAAQKQALIDLKKTQLQESSKVTIALGVGLFLVLGLGVWAAARSSPAARRRMAVKT